MSPEHRADRLALALVVAAAIAPSAHRFANEFTYDDVSVIVEGDVIHDVSNLARAWTSRTMFISSADRGAATSVDTYRPLTVTTFFVDAAWSERDPVGYHLTNALLHVLCCVGLFTVGRRSALLSTRGAAVAACFFAVHPWLVEGHVWINGRSDPLSLAFVLLSLLFLLPGTGRARLGAGVAFALALLAKETVLLLAPALVMFPTNRAWPARSELIRRAITLVVVAAGYLVLRASVLSGVRVGRPTTLLQAAEHLPVLLVDALLQSLVPHQLALRSLHDELGATSPWGPLALCLVAVAATLTQVRRHPTLVVGLVWFVAPLVPVAVIVTMVWPGFGRYLYPALPGLAWLVGWGFERGMARWPRTTAVVASVYLSVLALQTVAFTLQWRDNETLYGAAIRAHPDVAMGYGWMGIHLADETPADAIPFLEQAVLRSPSTHRYLARLGHSLRAVGRLEDATAIAARGIETFHGRPEEASYRMIAASAMTRRDPDQVAEHLVRCLEVWPGRPDCARALRDLSADPEHAAAITRAALRHPGVDLSRTTP